MWLSKINLKAGIVLLLWTASANLLAGENDFVPSSHGVSDRDSGELILNTFVASEDELAGSKAKQGSNTLLQVNDNTQNSLLERNQLQSEMTGDNVIHPQALQGIEGIATIIQNTGNQVIIQGSTLLNLSLTP